MSSGGQEQLRFLAEREDSGRGGTVKSVLKARGRRVDWVRVQRDYATGRFTDVELAAKHDTAREVIGRRRRADRALDPTSGIHVE